MSQNNNFRNWLRTLGAPEDPVATDTTSEWSLMSLVKALYGAISDGSFANAVIGRVESLVSLCQGAAARCSNYLRLCRARAVAAEASATNAATSETNAAASAVIAADAGGFAAGTALFGQRARKDRVAAAASATAAAASAASITSENLTLGIQVYF